ncbi:hypothetical protein GF371_01580, partial [Candidatus Woesearchaeota archaeon]|nr:hypothetical protein [Candidatus Woesearchaeota archaeon]
MDAVKNILVKKNDFTGFDTRKINYNGLNLAVAFSSSLNRIIKMVFNLAALEIFGDLDIKDIALFSFGSLARKEMVNESD